LPMFPARVGRCCYAVAASYWEIEEGGKGKRKKKEKKKKGWTPPYSGF